MRKKKTASNIKKSTSVALPPDVRAWVVKSAAQQERSASNFIGMKLRAVMEAEEKAR